VGRPSGTRTHNRELSSVLRLELQRHIELGRCAYCRTPAGPSMPLTREHVIPRARGGRRKDIRIIVPACARCNHHRGCGELIPFLLSRPRRISSFLDYLCTLSPESIRQMDLRIFAELYTSVAILRDCAGAGSGWRDALERQSGGRSLHRRRHAVRRALGAVAGRVDRLRGGDPDAAGPTCLIPEPPRQVFPLRLEEPLERIDSRLLSLMAVAWHLSAEIVERELARELSGSALCAGARTDGQGKGEEGGGGANGLEGIVRLDGWAPRPKRRRVRVDRRQGRFSTRGRAA